MQGIAEAWFTDVEQVLQCESMSVSDVRIGIFFTAVRLSSGHAGVAFTPREANDVTSHARSVGVSSPAGLAGSMAGQDAWTLARWAWSDVPLHRSVGVAVLNALSACAVARAGMPGQLVPGMDALAAAGIRPEDHIGMVGAFVPFIKKLRGQVADIQIIDKHTQALQTDDMPLWRPEDQATHVLSNADVVIITGSALVEGGLDELLDAAKQARQVVFAGPTASGWPSTFFGRGVHVMAGIHVHDTEKLLQIVSEGGSDAFKPAAEKVCILRP